MKPILIFGGGGTALNVIDLLLNEQKIFYPVGYIDIKRGPKILNIPYLGNYNTFLKLKKKYKNLHAFPAIGYNNKNESKLRKKIFLLLKKKRFVIPSLISNKAIIRSKVKISEGVLIQAGSVIDTGCRIEKNTHIGINNAIGHRVKISSHCNITGSVNIAGDLKIEEGVFLGMNSTINKSVGKWSRVSAGTTCLEKIPNHTLVYNSRPHKLKISRLLK